MCATRSRELGADDVHIAFTAHSIPSAMAANCAYEAQLRETARLVADAVGVADWAIAYQSRSGSPHVPWLEPDIGDHLRAVHERGAEAVVIAPIGFVSDHLEVLFDLDVEAREIADELGLPMARAGTAGTHPAFVAGLADLIVERMTPDAERAGARPVRAESRRLRARLLSAGNGAAEPLGRGLGARGEQDERHRGAGERRGGQDEREDPDRDDHDPRIGTRAPSLNLVHELRL